MPERLSLFATASRGTEAILAKELEALGAKKVRQDRGGVRFSANVHEALSMHEGALEALELAAREVVGRDTPRTRWLKDLCVHEGYHQSLLEAVQRFRRGESLVADAQAGDPDVSFKAWLRWCAAQD